MAPSIGGIFGADSAAAQFLLWGVGYGIAESLLAPVLTAVRQGAYGKLPDVALSPDQLADMVLKAIKTEADAAGEAAMSGIPAGSFHDMVLDAGEPPGLEFVLEAWRRGYIEWGTGAPGEASVSAAIRTSRLRNEWAATIEKMAVLPIGVADAVDAVVEGQIPRAEGEQIAYQNGISAADFAILVNTRGNPPSVSELLELHRRKLIGLAGVGPDQTTVQQGIYEGATKDKWWTLLADLATTLPPPRTVTALERAGVITPAQAVDLYQQAGLSPEIAAAYSADASTSRVAAHKQLAESQIVALVESHLATPAEATAMLEDLGYTAEEAGFVLALAEHGVAARQYNAAVGRIRSLYVARKITRAEALASLGHLSVPADAVADLLATWDTEVAASVRTLTPAEIVDAFHLSLIDQAAAQGELVAIGYTAYDAWLLLSIKEKIPLPDRPAGGFGSGPSTT